MFKKGDKVVCRPGFTNIQKHPYKKYGGIGYIESNEILTILQHLKVREKDEIKIVYVYYSTKSTYDSTVYGFALQHYSEFIKEKRDEKLDKLLKN